MEACPDYKMCSSVSMEHENRQAQVAVSQEEKGSRHSTTVTSKPHPVEETGAEMVRKEPMQLSKNTSIKHKLFGFFEVTSNQDGHNQSILRRQACSHARV